MYNNKLDRFQVRVVKVAEQPLTVKHASQEYAVIKTFYLEATDRLSLDAGFCSRGRDLSYFETRKARHRADHGLHEELYVLRRYLFSLEAAGELTYPLNLRKHETPDFIGNIAGTPYGIEVTEATTRRDQREMNIMDQTSEPALLGSHGGRYKNGIRFDGNPRGRGPDRDLTADILRAVRHKRNLNYPEVELDLVLYANGNAAMMAELETTLPLLKDRFARWGLSILAGTNIKTIAIVKDNEKKLIMWSSRGGLRVLDLHQDLS